MQDARGPARGHQQGFVYQSGKHGRPGEAMALNGFRSKIRSFILGHRKDATPVVMTEWGPVDESYRKQAALNMKADPEIKKRVERHFIKRCGGRTGEGLIACRRQFP